MFFITHLVAGSFPGKNKMTGGKKLPFAQTNTTTKSKLKNLIYV